MFIRYKLCNRGTRRATLSGFTVIEVMVTVAILAILASLAAPSFKSLTENWRVRQVVQGLQDTLYYARSEAIKRGGDVILQKIPSNSDGCTTSSNQDWDCGWEICVDADSNGTCDSGEEILREFPGTTNTRVWRSADSNKINFNRWGTISGSLGLGFTVYPLDKAKTQHPARTLNMSSGGRIQITSQ